MLKFISHIPSFYEETKAEVKRCTWPTRHELATHTLVVILTVVLLTLFAGGVDIVSQKVIQLIIAL